MIRVLAAATLAAVALIAAPAQAGGGQTVHYRVHVPAMVLDNLCNGEPVALSGDLDITTSTRPARNGGYTVTSTTNSRNLRGPGLVTQLPYRGNDDEQSYAYYAPPPYPSSYEVTHWTKLIPRGNAPSMYLVVVLREVVTADGTVVPTFERAYLSCKQPTCSSRRVDD
jgi:hypothetical protein